MRTLICTLSFLLIYLLPLSVLGQSSTDVRPGDGAVSIDLLNSNVGSANGVANDEAGNTGVAISAVPNPAATFTQVTIKGLRGVPCSVSMKSATDFTLTTWTFGALSEDIIFNIDLEKVETGTYSIEVVSMGEANRIALYVY